MRWRNFPPCICLFILTLLGPRTLPADTLIDDFQVNTEFPGHPPQDSPLSVANWGTQTIYTTWLSQRDGTNWDVALIRHTYDLEPIGEASYLNVREGTYNCVKPRLVVSSAGVGTAWIEARSPNRIMFRSLDGSGNPLSSPVRIEDDFQNILRDSLNIAALTDGYLLVWYDLRDSSKIWAQKVDFSGNLIGANFPIQPDSTGSILGLEAQNHPDGRVLVSWVTNGQYSRGRWLDAEGNFMGEVFEMADQWLDNLIAISLVRFEIGGTGILYQYAAWGEWGGGGEPMWHRHIYITYLDAMGVQTAERSKSGWWYWEEDFPPSSMISSFPDLIYLPDSNYVKILKRQSYNYGYGPDQTNNFLYSTLADTEIVPWGLAIHFDLFQTTDTTCLYTYNPGGIALRSYNINSLDSSQNITWISEPGICVKQDNSDICVHYDGSFRLIFNNNFDEGIRLYTRFFNQLGVPLYADTAISYDEDLNAVFINMQGKILRTSDDSALIIWNHAGDEYGTTFIGDNWLRLINHFDCGTTVSVPPSIDLNVTDHVMLLWNQYWWSGGLEFWRHQIHFQAFSQLFSYYYPASAIFPEQYGLYEYCDVALRNDGRFLICKNGHDIQAGVNYHELVGSPTAATNCEVAWFSLKKADNCYWLTWVYQDSVHLRQIDSDGNLIGDPFVISNSDAAAGGDPDLAVSDSSDNFAIVWQDARADSGDIFCRQFNPDGSFFGREYRVNSDPVGVLQKEPAVALGPNDQLYFTWTDYRNPGGQGDIYGKVIEWQDALYAPEELVQIPHKFALYPPSPNPFNSTTVIRFELPEPGKVTLQVFDISGRNVGAPGVRPGGGSTPALQQAWIDAGKHEVRFDGSGLASGVYIIRLQAGDHVAVQKMVLMK